VNTNLYITKTNPSFIDKEDQRKGEKKTKVLTLNKYMTMGSSAARFQESACRLFAGSKLLLMLLLHKSTPVWRRGRYLHRIPASRRSEEKESLESESAKYGR
jgi:hypothetical protein